MQPDTWFFGNSETMQGVVVALIQADRPKQGVALAYSD